VERESEELANINKEEVMERIKRFIKSRDEIIFSYIFGSFAENEYFNDIDLAIYIDENNSVSKKIFYEVELARELEEIIRIGVDVIVLNRASDLILYRATKGKLIKNSDDELRVNFVSMRWKKYWDFKNKVNEHMEEVKA